MYKYQFYISFNDKPGTASSKAIDDCTAILLSQGYRNFNINLKITNKLYFVSIFAAVVKLLFSIRPNAIVAIQYPLLSGNKMFRYIIKLLHARNVKVLGIVHDLDQLRYQQCADFTRHSDTTLLNDYDCVIVHNHIMMNWLMDKGVTTAMLPLRIFDYLSNQPNQLKSSTHPIPRTIVFAGNLSKSAFIYDLDLIADWKFSFYGPNIKLSKLMNKQNLNWVGSLSAEEILFNMDGSFGLIWDGSDLNSLDELYGNYLRFNNPHKLSLYLAAGLPVIVPLNSAIASFVKNNQCGLALPALSDLIGLKISAEEYNLYKENAYRIGQNLKTGVYLKTAILKAESIFISLSST